MELDFAPEIPSNVIVFSGGRDRQTERNAQMFFFLRCRASKT